MDVADLEIQLMCPVFECEAYGEIHADSTDFPAFSIESIENEGVFIARCKEHESGDTRG